MILAPPEIRLFLERMAGSNLSLPLPVYSYC